MVRFLALWAAHVACICAVLTSCAIPYEYALVQLGVLDFGQVIADVLPKLPWALGTIVLLSGIASTEASLCEDRERCESVTLHMRLIALYGNPLALFYWLFRLVCPYAFR